MHAFEQVTGHYRSALEILRRQGGREAVFQTLMTLGQTNHGAFAYEPMARRTAKLFDTWI